MARILLAFLFVQGGYNKLMGGMLAIVAFGAGCFSLDAAMGRKS